ncbi:transmembrane protein 214 [Cotesia typhae]|uniref:transmembrane protein 214 n=1 Tax=Cotesia typhae TaxID=2053667 RepID=UPI003D69C94B
MSSSGWELVTKNKKDKNSGKNNKLTKIEKKKFIESAPKVEDFLPLSQVQTLYDNFNGNKENKMPKDKDNKTKENEEKKKQQKLNAQVDNKKKLQQQKPKEKSKPVEKSAITVEQINELIETNRVKFPDAPLIWLKDLVAYLNGNISEKEEITPATKPDTYPLSLITKAVRTSFEKVIKSVGIQTAQLFYENTLLLMAKNMAFGSSSIGCKIFIQLLAYMHPEITCANIEKLISLRNSYQNKKSIGLAILWALGQGGKKNLTVGLTLWHEVMASMLESRNYAYHVTKILREMFTIHSKNINNSLTTDMYLNIVDDFCSGKINIHTSLSKEISSCLQFLRETVIQTDKIDVKSLFENTIDKINNKTNPLYMEELLRILALCVAKDNRSLSFWNKMHSKRLYQSELLIKQLTNDWASIRSEVDAKLLKQTLSVFQVTEVKPKKNKEDLLMLACQKRSQDLIIKMSATTKKGRSFPWTKGSFILLILIGALVAFDCSKHGSFEASTTGRLMRTSGVVGYGQKAWSTTKSYSNKGLVYLEASYPDYYKTASTWGRQYAKLTGDFYLVGRNFVFKLYNNTAEFVEQKKPIVVDSIEHYFPGWLATVQKFGSKQLELTKKYSADASDFIVTQSTTFIRWLETSVFVGKMSPENIRGYAIQAVESTQAFASQAYDVVYEKVQTLLKVQ